MLTVIAPRATESRAKNSASIQTLPDAVPAGAGVRPRITRDSPPGGRRFPTLTSSKSASVASVSPIQTPSAAFRSNGTDRSGPLYHSDRRRWSSRSKRRLPSARSGRGRRTGSTAAAPVRSMNVRRSIVSMLVALGALSTTLAAQSNTTQSDSAQSTKVRRHAISFGFVATLGAYWQIESAEIGYVRRPSHGFAALGLAARVGTFMNESAVLGGQKGFVFAATLSARTRMKSIAQFGTDEHGTGIGFDLTFEVTGYTAAHSPLALGPRWAAVSMLPAFSLGSGNSPHFGIVIGPTLFLHSGKPLMRGLLAFRGEAPLARRERHP